MKKRRRQNSASGVQLIEDVLHTAKSLSLSSWATYYAATFPFVLMFLYFWADMANHAFAHQRLAVEVTGLSVLFIVMKTGQSLFCRQALALVSDNFDLPRPHVLRIAVNQTIVQPTGFLVLPICLFILAPFGFSYAFYQNVTVLDDGQKTLATLLREAREQARLNPMQNHVMLWLLCPYVVVLATVFFLILLPIMRFISPEWTDSIMVLYAGIIGFLLIPLCPFGMIVALNLGSAFILLPMLIKMLLGIDTPFTISPMGAINPTFFVIVSGMTYLCLDPLIKIAYSLRCFHGSSIRTGQDLRIGLNRLARGVVGIILVGLVANIFVTHRAFASDTPPSLEARAEVLDEAVERTLQNRKFAWRIPRQRPEASDSGVFAAIVRFTNDTFEWVLDKAKALRDWIADWFNRGHIDTSAPATVSDRALKTIVVVLLIALLGVLAYVAWRTWRQTTIVESAPIAARPGVPDLEDEGMIADELPSNEWLRLATELMEKGDVRLAMRAHFFAGLARLSQLRLIRIASHKSNREYARELRRITHVNAELVGSFTANLRTFESVWYGDHVLSDNELGHYVRSQEKIGNYA